jgi:phage shock protein A
MSILNRLNRIIRSNVSDLRNAGQSSSLEGALGEMEASLKDARRQKAKLRQDEKRLVAAIREQRDKADQWEDRAMMALKQGEEDLARDALAVRNEALHKAAQLRESLEEHRMYLQDIESALEALEMKLEGTRGKLRASSSPSRRPQRIRDESDWDAEFRRRVGDRGARGDDDGASASRTTSSETSYTRDERLFNEMDRMGAKIDAFEAEVEAMRELSDENLRDPGRRRLEERFRNLENRDRRSDRDRRGGDSGPSDDLADLKKKFED